MIMCLFALAADAQPFHKQLSRSEKMHIVDGPFVIVTTTEAMPVRVKQAFSEITGEHSFALANPGRKYQATDLVVERGLPFRRLVFAGVKGNEWFLHYERGGRGHSYSVVLFKIDAQNRLQFLWGGVGFKSANSLEELRKMIAIGQFSDDTSNYW